MTTRAAYRETLAALAAKTEAKIPGLNGRVAKGLRLALVGDITLHADGHSTVLSSSDPTRRYEILDGRCPCRDWEQAPQHLCQHRLGAGLMRKALELMPQAPQEETASPATPLPEAPASVNVKVLVMGHEVMVTLRGSDETTLLTRLQALLKRADIRPVPKPAPRSGNWKRTYQGR
jgi:hypothetical protein